MNAMKDKNGQEIGLGDVVDFGWKDGYSQGTVCCTHVNGLVDVFRVYVKSEDFSYTGGVICYIGTEVVKNISTSGLTLVRKGPVLR